MIYRQEAETEIIMTASIHSMNEKEERKVLAYFPLQQEEENAILHQETFLYPCKQKS